MVEVERKIPALCTQGKSDSQHNQRNKDQDEQKCLRIRTRNIADDEFRSLTNGREAMSGKYSVGLWMLQKENTVRRRQELLKLSAASGKLNPEINMPKDGTESKQSKIQLCKLLREKITNFNRPEGYED